MPHARRLRSASFPDPKLTLSSGADGMCKYVNMIGSAALRLECVVGR